MECESVEQQQSDPWPLPSSHAVLCAGLGQKSPPVPVPHSWRMTCQLLEVEPPTCIVLLILGRGSL